MAGGRRSVPVIASLLYTAIGALPLFVVSAYSVRLQQDLGFGATRYGIAVSIYFATISVASPILGRIVERQGPRASMRGAALCACGAMVGFAIAVWSWAALVGFLCLAAVANSSGQLAANLTLARGVLPHRRGMAFGLKQSAVPAAGLAAGTFVPVVGAALGWRLSIAVLSLVPAFAVFLVPDFVSARRPDETAVRGRRIHRPELLVLAAAATCGGATGNSLAMFIVGAATSRGIGGVAASSLLAVGSAASIAMRLLSGWAVDRRESDGRAELCALMLGGASGFVLLSFSGESLVLFLLGTLAAFGAGWGWPGLLYHHVVHRFPDVPGAATGTVMSGTFLGTIVGPSVIGALATHSSYALAWGLAGMLLVVAVAILGGAGPVARRA